MVKFAKNYFQDRKYFCTCITTTRIPRCHELALANERTTCVLYEEKISYLYLLFVSATIWKNYISRGFPWTVKKNHHIKLLEKNRC